MQLDETPQGFDLTVTHRDPKTGAITKRTPYVLRVVGGPDGNRTQLFERPKGSGNLFDGQGRPCGRWVKGEHHANEEHIAFVAPLTEDEKLKHFVIEKDAKIVELEKELAAIKAEASAKTQAKKTEAAPKAVAEGETKKA